ncbi:MAG: hypothetical protein JWN15_2644, partial [Firmicutes bacterium]|nr:hypothetical protein [Bacillota bacterium]
MNGTEKVTRLDTVPDRNHRNGDLAPDGFEQSILGRKVLRDHRVATTPTTAVGSDHLPVVADL